MKRDWEREMKELTNDLKLRPEPEMSAELRKEFREGGLAWLFGSSEPDKQRDDRETVELDRQVKEEQKGREEEPERDERDRGDDLAGGDNNANRFSWRKVLEQKGPLKLPKNVGTGFLRANRFE